MRFLISTSGLVAALFAFGCGSGKPEIPDELLAVDSASGGNYPRGPYGQEIGDTLGDLSFHGYRSPDTNRELEEIRFSDFYDPYGDKGLRLLLINTAAAWCQPCQIEHDDLPDRVREFEGRGLAVLSLLFQDQNGDPADLRALETWATLFDTNFPMALDPSYQMGLYGPAETPPLNLIVDASDMTLIATFIGNQEGPMWDFIERTLRESNE